MLSALHSQKTNVYLINKHTLALMKPPRIPPISGYSARHISTAISVLESWLGLHLDEISPFRHLTRMVQMQHPANICANP